MSRNEGAEFVPEVESDELPRQVIGIVGIVTVAVVVASIFVSKALLHADSPAPEAAGESPRPGSAQQGIVEQTLVLDTRRGLSTNEAQQESLRHFGWANRERGLAKVPIDRAMDLVLDPAFERSVFGASPAHTQDQRDAGPARSNAEGGR